MTRKDILKRYNELLVKAGREYGHKSKFHIKVTYPSGAVYPFFIDPYEEGGEYAHMRLITGMGGWAEFQFPWGERDEYYEGITLDLEKNVRPIPLNE